MGSDSSNSPRTLTDPLVVGAQRDAFVRGYVQGNGASLDTMLKAAEQAKVEYPLYRHVPKVLTDDEYEYKFVNGQMWYKFSTESDRNWTPDEVINFDFMKRILELRANPTELVVTDE